MDWLWIFSQNSHSMRFCHLIFFWGKGCTACIGTYCVNVGEWLSWRYQAQKGTKEQVKIPNTATLLLIWSAEHHQRTTALMQNTVCKWIYVFDMYIFCYLFPFEAWVAAMIRMCRQFFCTVRGKKTIPKRYPNDTPKRILRALGRRSPAHPPTWTKHWHTKSWCNVFPFHISWVEAMAWKKEKKKGRSNPKRVFSKNRVSL